MGNHERMQGLIDNLQAKIKTYKKQLEEAEETAALNLAKFRKVQVNLQESSNVAEVNECALAKARARGRSTSVGPHTVHFVKPNNRIQQQVSRASQNLPSEQ